MKTEDEMAVEGQQDPMKQGGDSQCLFHWSGNLAASR